MNMKPKNFATSDNPLDISARLAIKVAAYEEILDHVQATYKGQVMHEEGAVDTMANKLVTHLTDSINSMRVAIRRQERSELRAAKAFVERVL